MYDPSLGRFHASDPHAENYLSWTPYNYVANNPINLIDPNGMDWYDINGVITWHDNEGDLTIGDNTYSSLGRNVLVGFHNRDENGEEDINSARFELYLESNTEGATATTEGNTVPGDTEKFGTLVEDLYSARYKEFKGKPALLIGEGGGLMTLNGNPNNPANYNSDGSLKPVEEHIMDRIYFHKGNTHQNRLWYSNKHGDLAGYISEGCQVGSSGEGSYNRYLNFMESAKGFNGNYYLRSNIVNGGSLQSVNVFGKRTNQLNPIIAPVNY